MLKRIPVLFMAVGLVACQTTPEVEELQSRNRALQEDLEQARQDVDALQTERQSMQRDINELDRLVAVLEAEKNARQQESSHLRTEVRSFVQGQIETYRRFLAASELLDYMGNELIERRHRGDEGQLLVDLNNPVPRNGALTGVGAYVNVPAPFMVKVLRPIGDELVAIWESQLIEVDQPGSLRRQFPFSVGIEAGDYLAYYFPEDVAVSFDEGTGNTQLLDRNLRLGESIARSSLRSENGRSYSIGVYGLLNLP